MSFNLSVFSRTAQNVFAIDSDDQTELFVHFIVAQSQYGISSLESVFVVMGCTFM